MFISNSSVSYYDYHLSIVVSQPQCVTSTCNKIACVCFPQTHMSRYFAFCLLDSPSVNTPHYFSFPPTPIFSFSLALTSSLDKQKVRQTAALSLKKPLCDCFHASAFGWLRLLLSQTTFTFTSAWIQWHSRPCVSFSFGWLDVDKAVTK